MMKKLALVFLLTALSLVMRAQDIVADSVFVAPQLDSTLLGLGLEGIMPDGVVISQSPAVRMALEEQIAANAGKQYNGYCIRIYFNSVQSAREESKAALRRFQEEFPEIPASLTFASPNFRVTAGSFRTRIDAELALARIKESFPAATIIRDKFKYPVL